MNRRPRCSGMVHAGTRPQGPGRRPDQAWEHRPERPAARQEQGRQHQHRALHRFDFGTGCQAWAQMDFFGFIAFEFRPCDAYAHAVIHEGALAGLFGQA